MQIRYIRDWMNGSNKNGGNHWYEIKAFTNHAKTTNIAQGKTVTASSGGANLSRITDGSVGPGNYAHTSEGSQWVRVDLGELHDVKCLQLYHYHNDYRTYNGKKTEVSVDGSTWITIYDQATHGNYSETPWGKELWIPNSFSDLSAIFGNANPVSLNEFYRGGSEVPNHPMNHKVPTSGLIGIDKLFGVCKNYGQIYTTHWTSQRSTGQAMSRSTEYRYYYTTATYHGDEYREYTTYSYAYRNTNWTSYRNTGYPMSKTTWRLV